MLYFGSRNFGQANFGKGLITTAVDETSSTSTMVANGYLIFDDCRVNPNAVTTAQFAGGRVQGSFFHVATNSALSASGIKMIWDGNLRMEVAVTTLVSGYVAWDGQQISETIWTNQNID